MTAEARSHIQTSAISQSSLMERRYNGGIFSVALSVETLRSIVPRVYPGQSRSSRPGYAASRPVVFGLSSSPELLREKRFSALPKPA